MIRTLKWLILLLLWIYIIYRAYVVPMTHDEAYSFLLVKTNYINALAGTANTHWLNSLGMKLGSLFSYHPFALRIFSVLAWLLYGYSALKISDRTNRPLASIALFVALTCNPFLLDFFSLSRGYGLACAFTLASIWQLISVLERGAWSTKEWLPVVLFGSLAVFSNYTALYFFLSLIGSYLFFIIVKKQWHVLWPLRINWWYTLVIGTSLIAIANLLFIKLYTGDLEYGGHSDFISSLFGSLIRGSLYVPANFPYLRPLTYIVVGLTGISVLRALLQYFLHRNVTPFVYLSAILFGMLFLNLFFHVAFDTPYLLLRTTLVLYPVIILVLFYFFETVTVSHLVEKPLSIGLSIIILVGYSLLLGSSFNLRYCFEWKDQAETKQCLDALVKENPQNVLLHRWHGGVLVNYYKVIEPNKYTFNFKSFNNDDQLVDLLQKGKSAGQVFDHVILLPPYDLQRLKRQGMPFTIIAQYPITDAIVVKLNSY